MKIKAGTMRRMALGLLGLVLLSCTGCKMVLDHSGYFYVTTDGEYYRCAINNGIYVSKTFRDVHRATDVCDALNKALGQDANIYTNDNK